MTRHFQQRRRIQQHNPKKHINGASRTYLEQENLVLCMTFSSMGLKIALVESLALLNLLLWSCSKEYQKMRISSVFWQLVFDIEFNASIEIVWHIFTTALFHTNYLKDVYLLQIKNLKKKSVDHMIIETMPIQGFM